jgi:release factor glutamine methyltransferase
MDTLTVRRALVQAGLAPLDAQALLAHVLSRDRAWLIAHATDPLAAADVEAFFVLARRRRDGEPVAYLTGRREFWGLLLTVDRSVLIPRPETETVVEHALRKLPRDRPVRVLDLGTGSGAIALAIARERPQATVMATDCSGAALEIARENAERLGLANVEFVETDWFEGLPRAEPFDVIASNPPYVARGDPHLREGDVRFEPAAGLTSGAEGLDALTVIAGAARDRLVPSGWLVVEHGFDQAPKVRDLLIGGGFRDIASFRDLSGIPRVAAGRAP